MSSITNYSLLGDILQFNNASVVNRISKEISCSNYEAQKIFEDTKRFLYLCGVSEGNFVPTKKIDAGWHAFILHTKSYMDFCLAFFGKFIHHFPADGSSEKEKDLQMMENTIIKARELFGELSENWFFTDTQIDILIDGALGPCSDKPCNDCSNTSTCQSSSPD